MKKAFIISLAAHVGMLLFLYYFGWSRSVEISVPQVYRVQLINIPEVQAAPAEEPVLQVDVETIPPPPEEKKQIKPKQKKAEPQQKKQNTDKRVIQQPKEPTDQAVAGVRSDEQFEFPWYIRLMTQKIRRNWQNPYAGTADSVLCTVYFRVQRSGQVTEARVEESSGEPSFDRAALRAVINSSPLPQLPPDYGESRLTVHLDFEYRKQ